MVKGLIGNFDKLLGEAQSGKTVSLALLSPAIDKVKEKLPQMMPPSRPRRK
jgi:hypothetical protein